MKHRETWAEEKQAPTKEFWQKVEAGQELWPPRPQKEKEEEKPEPKLSSGPKVIIRRKG